MKCQRSPVRPRQLGALVGELLRVVLAEVGRARRRRLADRGRRVRLRHRDDRDLGRRAARALARRVDARAHRAPALGDRGHGRVRSRRRAGGEPRPRATGLAQRREHLDQRQADHVGHRAADLARPAPRRCPGSRTRRPCRATRRSRRSRRSSPRRARPSRRRCATRPSRTTGCSSRSPTRMNAVITWCTRPDSQRSIFAASSGDSALPRICAVERDRGVGREHPLAVAALAIAAALARAIRATYARRLLAGRPRSRRRRPGAPRAGTRRARAARGGAVTPTPGAGSSRRRRQRPLAGAAA